jgi:hypothetical protein
MKLMRTFCLLAMLGAALSGVAQSAAKTPSPSPTRAKAETKPSIGGVVDMEVGSLEREFVGAAEAMPDDKYDFAPTSLNIAGSEFKSVRTFAEQVKHVAATNFLLWGAVTGDKSPVPIKDDNGPDSLKTKAEIVQYLKDSFALGHKAAKMLTPETAMAMVPSPFGQGRITKLFCGTFAVAHAFDHYGQMVEYLRMNGIVPPASRQSQ